MKTITLPGFVKVEPCERWSAGSTNSVDGFAYQFYGFKMKDSFPATVTVELPDDFDPRPAAVKELEKKRTTLQAEFQMALNAINDQISKLQAIGHEVVA